MWGRGLGVGGGSAYEKSLYLLLNFVLNLKLFSKLKSVSYPKICHAKNINYQNRKILKDIDLIRFVTKYTIQIKTFLCIYRK